jgi:hypothetical protein
VEDVLVAIALEFINVIVRREAVERKYPGGWEAFVRDVSGIGVWHDEHLLRGGAMNQIDADRMLDWLKGLGLKPTAGRGVSKRWFDVCVVGTMSGPTLPCDWLEVDQERSIAFLKGREPSAVVGPTS